MSVATIVFAAILAGGVSAAPMTPQSQVTYKNELCTLNGYNGVLVMDVAYETASQKDNKNPEVYLKRALIWQRATKLDLAIKECEDGVKIDPDYAPLYKLLAELHYSNGNFDKVTGDLDRYLSKTKIEDPDARLRFIKFFVLLFAFSTVYAIYILICR